MNPFDAYMASVADADLGLRDYPSDPKVPGGTPFLDKNGSIHNVAFANLGGAAVIESVARSIRSNHYHKTDWHFLVVLHGVLNYYARPAGSSADPEVYIFREGDIFFTGPMVEHAVFSPTTSTLLSLSRLSRRHDTHEGDVVRSPLIENINGKIVVVKKK